MEEMSDPILRMDFNALEKKVEKQEQMIEELQRQVKELVDERNNQRGALPANHS